MKVSALTGKANYFEDFTVGDVMKHARGKTVEPMEQVWITNVIFWRPPGNRAPTAGEIDISLSFSMTMNFFKSRDMLLRASNETPQVSVASPITGQSSGGTVAVAWMLRGKVSRMSFSISRSS